MARASRSGSVVLAALASLAGAACGGSSSAPQGCAADADCPASSRCVSSACVANAAPVPRIVVAEESLKANALVSFDASSSADPDPDDSIVSYGWSFRALAAGCAPPTAAGNGPVATVRFECAGRYAVDLTVTDEQPASATTTRELDVSPRSEPELLTAGPNVVLEHTCSSLPTHCVADGEIALSAALAGTFAAEEVAFEWAVEPPPDRPLDAGRRVTFTPSERVDSPVVTIETDGQAISGDWVFRVRARDAAGVVGSAATVVSVGNRPPVLEKTIPVIDHAFDATARRFTAVGEIPFSVVDPDGDALVGPVVEFRHAGDGEGATFSGALAPSPLRLTFQITVPFDAPADALHLIDETGPLERTIVFAVTDVNGAEVAEQWPIVVANRPPVLVGGPAASAFDHSFDPGALAYRAAAVLSRWSDPDGDPLFQAPSVGTGDPLCPDVTVPDGVGPRAATVACSLPFAGTPLLANFAGAHTVTQAIQDPWAAAAQASTVTFTIGNRAPQVVSPGTAHLTSQCSVCGSNCGIPSEPSPSYCAPASVVQVPAGAADPDGDPLEFSATPNGGLSLIGPAVCTSTDGCTLSVRVDGLVRACADRQLGPLTYTASDGVSSGSTVLSVSHGCTSFF